MRAEKARLRRISARHQGTDIYCPSFKDSFQLEVDELVISEAFVFISLAMRGDRKLDGGDHAFKVLKRLVNGEGIHFPAQAFPGLQSAF